MNRIFREASKKFNITQAQAENIYLSMFKFIRDELDPTEIIVCFNLI